MAMSRSFGATSLTTPLADADLAAGDFLQPGDHAQQVDLPQPDGPTSTTNSPSAMSRSTACSTLHGAEVLLDIVAV